MTRLAVFDDAEAMVVSAILQGGRPTIESARSSGLTDDDFGSPDLRSIYKTVLELSGGPTEIDPVTVSEYLAGLGQLASVGGKEAIAALIDVAPTAANVSYHAAIVRDHGVRRRASERLAALAKSVALAKTPLSAVAEELINVGDDLAHATKHEMPGLQLDPLGAVEMQPVRWLWKDYLPIGKIVVDGFPGQGKSTLMLDIAARLSRGLPMPDGSACGGPADSVVVTYEDDPADTVKPRVIAAEGDPSRIFYVRGTKTKSHADLTPPSFPRDIGALDAALGKNPSIRLVVVDPLSAALGVEIDSHRDQDVRRALSRLAALASERAVCVVLIRHIRKSHGGNAVTAGGGSIGIIGQARVGFLVDRHPELEDASVLAMVKANVGPIARSLTFRKRSASVQSAAGDVQTSVLEWQGEANFTADELLRSHDDSSGGGHDVTEWLRQVLADGLAVERKAILKMAAASGFPERTVDRAAKRLGVLRERTGYGAEMRAFWRLASSSSASSASSLVRAEMAEVARLDGMAERHTGDLSSGNGAVKRSEKKTEPGSLAERAVAARMEAEMRRGVQGTR